MATISDDLVTRLWASDEASALTNQAARRIEADAKLIQEMREALSMVRDRFCPENQPERDRDLMWEQINSALSKAKSQQEGETE